MRKVVITGTPSFSIRVECCRYDDSTAGFQRQILITKSTKNKNGLCVFIYDKKSVRNNDATINWLPDLMHTKIEDIKSDLICVFDCGLPLLTMEQIYNCDAIYKLSGIEAVRSYLTALYEIMNRME